MSTKHGSSSGQLLVLPFERRDVPFSRTGLLSTLACPNINSLPKAFYHKAERLVLEMSESLRAGSIDIFNQSKQQLVQLLKKQGEPITQWNPLILELVAPDLLAHANLSGINLTMSCLRSSYGRVSLNGANLTSASMLCADLSQVLLIEADLSGADMRFADLREADVLRAQLVSTDLSNAKLSFADLTEANLYCAKLNSVLAKQVTLTEANLRKADLRNADLYHANLRFARLQHADLREANLFMADLTGSRLRNADLRKAQLVFCILREARLMQARLEDANLTNASLVMANLQKSRMSEAVLNRALMSYANLQCSELGGAHLAECFELETAQLSGALYDKQTAFPRGFRPKRQGMQSIQFRGLKKVGGWLPGFLKRQPTLQEI